MKLREYLRQAKLSQRGFAAEIGVSEPSVSHWLAGRTVPEGRTMAAIEKATQGAVTAADFLAEASPRPATPPPRKGFAEVQSPLLPEAEALGLDTAAITEAALRKAISDEKARRWAEENREAIEAWNRYFEENDTPLAQYRMF